jgi:hypothetical protein
MGWKVILAGASLLLGSAAPAAAATFTFSTGDPDGRLAAASRPGGPSQIEIETADDFLLDRGVRLTGASFTGLLSGASVADITGVTVEFYCVFPDDSDASRTPNVITRVNSPADVAFDSRADGGGLAFSAAALDPSFTTGNSVLSGIFPSPNSHTGGDGSATGQEVAFDIAFTTPVLLSQAHWFFVPQVQLANGDFYWLSTAHPVVSPGPPFAPDLQAWIRNGDLDPDWLRLGTDVIGQTTYNMAFSLSGDAVPEPPAWGLMIGGLGLAGAAARRRRMRPA